MKRITKLMVFAGAMLAASCSENEIMEVKQNDQIFFRTEIARQTRATSTTVNTLGAFNITAWKDDPDPSNDAPIIQNAEFTRGTSDVYKASGNTQYYWPKGVDVKFYAYAPKAAAGNGLTYSSAKRIDVEPLADTDSQVDLLYAANTGNKVQNAINGVTLNFRHTMSQIQVRVKNSLSDVNFKVTGWKIAGVDGSAYFEFDDASTTNDAASGSQNTLSGIMWHDNNDNFTASYTKTITTRNVTGVNSSWGMLTGSAILIPQGAAKATAYSGSDPVSNPLNGAYIAIQYQALDGEDNELAPAGTWGCWPVRFDWLPGFRYIYTIDLAEYGYKEKGKDELEPISEDLNVEFKFVDVEIDEWQPTDDDAANKDVTMAEKYPPYLLFHAVGGQQKLGVTKDSGNDTETHLEYSYDAVNWDNVEFNDMIPFGGDGVENKDLYLRGMGFYNEVIDDSHQNVKRFYFQSNDIPVECTGSIGALTDYEYPSAPLTKPGQYAKMFMGCRCLKKAPEMPSEVLTMGCYAGTYYGCWGLTVPPALPATELEDQCYIMMFADCRNMTTAPALPATVLADRCYYQMFVACTKLINAPALPATTLVNNCYEEMFYKCTNLTKAPEISATTLADSCCYRMFYECSNLSVAPTLPAMTMAKSCYSGMFMSCSKLKNAPELPATTLADSCYYWMFYQCYDLVNPPVLPATKMATSCYDGMFIKCTSLTTAPELPSTDLADYCYGGMFRECSSLTQAPVLPATVLAEGCYGGMFYQCSSLSYVKALFIDDNNSCNGWLMETASNGTIVRNPSATWNTTDYDIVPSSWTVITE